MEPEVMAQVWTSGLRQDSLSLLTGDDGLSVENCFAEVVDLVGEHRRRGLVHPLDRMQDFYFRFFLPYDLSKLERAVAAHGIQARSPLLDRALIAQVASLPPPVRFRGLRFKPILKQIMRGELPPPILHRTKRGFSVPLGRWMRGDMRDFVSDTLHSKTLGDLGLVRQASVDALLRDHLTGARDNRKELWTLVTFVLWAREHLFRGKP
jgi:asparagine synthase (glutamine-hydrolysing)